MTWREVAEDNRQAAAELLGRKTVRSRSVCNRAYYAAYAHVAGLAPSGFSFGYGTNPTHPQIQHIVQHLPGKPQKVKDYVNAALSRLWKRRVSADYQPAMAVGEAEARESLRDCLIVFREL